MYGLPFNVGQLAEARSFEVGFRGAWFRCKIRKFRKKNGILSFLLEYIDYPDQKLEWIKVYQKHPAQCKKGKSKITKRQLMVRPWFPPIYPKSEKPNISTISGVVVVVDNAWNVGDLVDWWSDGCYWAGRVKEILENGKFKIDLLPPPMGEGLSYEAFSKDIRPSLDWCREKGWTVPMPMLLDGEKQQRPCARVINPEHPEDIPNTNAADETSKVVQTSISASFEGSSSFSSHNTEDLDSLEGPNGMSYTTIDGTKSAVVDTSIRISNSRDCASTSHIEAASPENMIMITENDDGLVQKKPSKKMRKDNSICLDSKFMNSIEDAVLDLEELVNKVKWIRGILKFGMPLSSSNQSFWEFCQVDAPGSKK